MTDHENHSGVTERDTDADPPRADSAPEAPPVPRRKTLQFVVLFVVYVFALLVGYRYAVNTEANMWYLFTTAKHTSALLSLIGEHSSVESQGLYANPQLRRGQLKAWREGRAFVPENVLNRSVAAARRDTGAPRPEPLTPYENWLHRAYQTIHSNGTLDSTGPSVEFIAKYGIRSKLQRADSELNRLDKTNTGPERQAELETELEALAAKRDALPEGKERNYALDDRKFTFVLVPDCGAIEVMAIYVAAVLAFPTLLRRRFVGLLGGLPILYGVNLIRLSSLAYLAAYDPTTELKWFHFGHEFVWQAIFIIFVVAVWLCWIEFVVQRRRA
jgi:exosortase/archaeosortase family protein